MLLDRAVDTFLAHRSDADGWLIKPLDAFRLRQAAKALLDGGTWFEGVDEPDAGHRRRAVETDEPADDRRAPAARLMPRSDPDASWPRDRIVGPAARSGTIASPYGL